MPFKLCIVLFLNGVKDSLYGCVRFFQRQKQSAAQSKSKKTDKLYQRLFESCILNGVFLLACMLAFSYMLMPILNWIYFKMLSPGKHDIINNYLNPCLQLTFSFVWILPVFLLSKIFNLLWHQEIADIAFVQKYDVKSFASDKLVISHQIADTIFSCIMELIFLVQSSLINLIPLHWLSQLLCHVHLAFLYSLYAFEYKWFNMSWDIEKRISFIESRWPYFFGFGLSLSIILSFAGSYFYGATLFAFIFPGFILSAIEADCEYLKPIVYVKNDMNGLRPVVLKLPLFRLSLRVTDFIFKIFEKKKKKNTASNVVAPNPSRANFTIKKTN